MTARIIATALVPGSGKKSPQPGRSTLVARKDGFTGLTPGDLRQYLGDLRALMDERRQLRLFLQGCRAPAAPFLLFRLKRQGFSRCKAEAAPEGIYLSAHG